MQKRFKKVYIEITNACNLSCDFCIKNKRDIKFISISEFKQILDKIEDYTDYLYFHVLGEPLIHPLINEFIDTASKKFNINITTNGYNINKLKTKNVRQINISLHSYDEKYNVPLNEYLNTIFTKIEEYKNNNTYISLRLWVKNKYNNKIIDFINERYNTNVEYDVKNYKINNNLFINNFHEFIWPDLSNNIYEEKGTCYGLIDHIGILVDGTVIPCCLDSSGVINLGNIYKENLQNIITSTRAENIIKGFKNNIKVEEYCKHCKFINK